MLANPRKAVEMLRLLDAAAVDAVLAQLPEPQAQSLRTQLTAPPAPAGVRGRALVLDEFQRGLQLAASPERGPALTIHQPGDEEESTPEFTTTGDPFEDLKRLNVHQVSQALETESPRATAVLLTRLPAERSAEILSILPDARRDATVREMNQDRVTPNALAERMAAAVVARAAQLPATPPNRADRIDRLAAVLRAVPKEQRRTMLTAIREQDETAADTILQRLYTFDDLRQLPDRRIQMLLTEVDLTLLSTALAGTGPELVEKISNNLSRRARASLQEEMQFRSEPPAKEVEAARAQIATVIAKLDQEE